MHEAHINSLCMERLALSGVEVITNGSGSHHQLRKLDKRLDLIMSATAKVRIYQPGLEKEMVLLCTNLRANGLQK